MERKDATDTFTTRAKESGTAIMSRHETTSRGQQRAEASNVHQRLVVKQARA